MGLDLSLFRHQGAAFLVQLQSIVCVQAMDYRQVTTQAYLRHDHVRLAVEPSVAGHSVPRHETFRLLHRTSH